MRFKYVLICGHCRYPWIVSDEMTPALPYADSFHCPECGSRNPVPEEVRKEVAECKQQKKKQSS